MGDSEYFGLLYKVMASPESDGTGFVEVGKCYDVSKDDSTDSVDRSWTDGTSQEWTTNYKQAFTFRVSKTTAANLGNIVPQNTYAAGDPIDGLTGVTAGTGGAVQMGLPVDGKEATIKTLQLQPLNSAQAPITAFNCSTSISEHTLDDGLSEVTVRVSAERVIQGSVVFA